MEDVVFDDILEQILVRLAVKDIFRCKSVCKSWYSFISRSISSSAFVNSHLKHINNTVGRIIMKGDFWKDNTTIGRNPIVQSSWRLHLVGSCNGLVCMFTSDYKLCVLNPCTKELKSLENLGFPVDYYSMPHVNGFGYDPSSDDYKVILSSCNLRCFYLLSLKSNVWKVVRNVDFTFAYNSAGIVCNGALHWLMPDQKRNTVLYILSFHLSTEEFKEIPTPADHKCESPRLGIIEECLCIFDDYKRDHPKWVMKNYNDTQSWELLPHLPQWDKDIIAHSLKVLHLKSYYQTKTFFHCNLPLSETRQYMSAPVFVQSLVSPYVHISKKLKRKRSFYGEY